MDQREFDSIQKKFKQFLSAQTQSTQKTVVTEVIQPVASKRTIREIEKTSAFGSEDAEIGYKVSWTGKDGRLKTKLY